MIVAFYCVMEPEKRAELINLAESFASQSQVVEGCTHFLLLDRGAADSALAEDPDAEVVLKPRTG
jgi:quinol monooxygenase YgiN